MNSCNYTKPNQMTMADVVHMNSNDLFHGNVCRTRRLVDDFYVCQVGRIECKHSLPFGKSYLCRSIKRHELSDQSY